jgi:hypothetical protein
MFGSGGGGSSTTHSDISGKRASEPAMFGKAVPKMSKANTKEFGE